MSVEDLETAGRLGRVRGLFVLPDARGVGVGEVMMDQVVRWCREQGCSGIDGYALPGNRATKNFFETFGFTARLLTVHRRLDD